MITKNISPAGPHCTMEGWPLSFSCYKESTKIYLNRPSSMDGVKPHLLSELTAVDSVQFTSILFILPQITVAQ